MSNQSAISPMPPQLNISEIFYSIQGESSFAGYPCVFVRLSGCNLRCDYCDATYTWEQGDMLEIDAILSAVDSYHCNLVEVTGGEPLIQEHTLLLLKGLLSKGKKVLLESNGSMAIDSIPDEATIILDVKCPDSGSARTFLHENLETIKKRKSGSVELKFVLSSKDDYLWAKEFIEENDLNEEVPILFSPVRQSVAPQDLARWIMTDSLAVRLQLQLHTILWPHISRGV